MEAITLSLMVGGTTSAVQAMAKLPTGLLAQRYEVSEENDIIELISAVAVNRKCLSKGGEPDYSKAAALIIDDFRSGKLGHITLERPEI